MKKIFLFFTFCFLLIVFSGCGKKVMMDELNKEGFYPYSNEALSFDLSLPAEFEYFQTQRRDDDRVKRLEIFVPTADQTYLSAVPTSYAKPVTVEIMEKSYYDNMNDDADKQALIKVGEKGGNIYVIKIWDITPSDWQEKWTEAMRQQIINNFKLK